MSAVVLLVALLGICLIVSVPWLAGQKVEEEEEAPERPTLTNEQQLVWTKIYEAKSEYYRGAIFVTHVDLEDWTWDTYLSLNHQTEVKGVETS